MHTTKSFCNVDAFVSNEPGVSNTLGEVTAYIQTFSREVGKYAIATYPSLTLYNTYSKLSSGADVESIAIPTDTVQIALDLCNFIVVQIVSSSGEIFQDILQQQLAEYAPTVGATGIVVGEVHQHGGRWGPDFISFTLESDTTQEHTIWFSSTAMASQYTEYEIVVVPPFTPIDNFFTTPGNVLNLLNAVTPEITFERINTATGGLPATLIVSQSYDYNNPQNPSQKYATHWSLLIYGPAGNNVDSIKDAIVAYILANSSHTRDNWVTILPDIFKRTEFILAPFWHKYAIEPMVLYPQGVRSPVVNVEEITQVTAVAASEYNPTHIENHVNSTSFTYTGMAVTVIGSVENRDNKYSFLDYYPDYFVAATTSIEFNRMSQETQDWVIQINNMLAYAENMTGASSVPIGFTRVTRGNMVYISKTIQNVAYLVAVKETMIAALNP